jgi:hypothetical protein
MRSPREKERNRLRRWPERDFLGELEPSLAETNALDDVARRDPHLRRLRRRLTVASKPIRRAVSPRIWVAFSDAKLDLSLAEFELAFNLGFENGLLAGRTPRGHRRGTTGGQAARFAADLRRLIAGALIPRPDLLSALLDLSTALARGAPARVRSAGDRRPR